MINIGCRTFSPILVAALLMTFSLPAPSLAGQSELKPISVRLAWVFDMAEVGLFVAADMGYFANEGLDVKIEPGGFGLDPIRLVASGQNDFGVAGAGNVLLARSKKIPVVAIAAEFQDTPVGFIVRADSGINAFKDFTGRRVGVQTGADTDVLFRALMAKNAISDTALSTVPIQYDVAPFVSRQIDVLPAYITNQPITLREVGLDVRVISAASEGLRYYGNVYIASEKILTKDPKVARAFLRAARQGWLTAFSQKEAAVEAVHRRAPEFGKEALAQIYEAVMPFIKGEGTDAEVLKMSEERWQTTKEVLLDAALLDKDFDLQGAFSNHYLD